MTNTIDLDAARALANYQGDNAVRTRTTRRTSRLSVTR